MNILPILLGGAAIYVLSSSKKKSAPLNSLPPSQEDKDTSEYEDFPDEVNVQKNEENIFQYFSKEQIYLNQIPLIYSDMAKELQFFYDPNSELKFKKTYIFLKPEFAEFVWDYALYLINTDTLKIPMPTDKSKADAFTKVILEKNASNVYWKEGLIPYKYDSPFRYVWSSVNFLVRIVYANIKAKKGETIGLSLPKSIDE